MQTLEGCDVGAANDGGVGCSKSCSVDLGFSCMADGGPSTCASQCGDGLVTGAETCDDGPLNDEPGHCNATCSGTRAGVCGDGRIQVGEGCDDGAMNGDPGKCEVGCPVRTLPLPAQSSTYSSNVRGYWFTAPKDFVITSLRVPTTAVSGNQSIAVLRFPAEPPIYSATTDTFETLFLAQNVAQDEAFAVTIPVSTGDVIGVLGQRATTSSYGPAGTVTFDDTSVTLARLGMQFPLTTTAPQQLWTEGTTNISRVDMSFARSQCGDGARVKTEGCDDGNLVAGDGCSATCTVEPGFACSEGPVGIAQSTCTATCGDGTKASTEACDDGADNGMPGKCYAGCVGLELGVGAHATLSPTGTDGFWFTAPVAFTLTGIRVPAEAGAGDQALQIVKLLEAPPASGAPTNAFQTLAYVRAVAADTITRVNLPLAAGERIAILGGRGAGAALTSSLTAAGASVTVKGQAIPLKPVRFAGSLDTSQASNLLTKASGAFGRVEVFYSP